MSMMDGVMDMYHTLKDMRKRQMAHQVLNLAMIVCSALMIWKGLMVVTESESPVVVVLSGSMEPAFHRGDILFLHMGHAPFRAGDIVVFKAPMSGKNHPFPRCSRHSASASPPSPLPRPLPCRFRPPGS
mmetsp:Transcript_33880/g.108820  ORF Transcript_33880/g.108820 Transcript_33880/m.108820 type:complete len:129 (+) Transcript_33880:95-481(+)